MGSTITVSQSVTLDGVMQGPGRDDEDPRGGFMHGGWTNGYQDEVLGGFVAERLATETALLFGRRTYEDVLGYWTSTPGPNPFTDVLVNAQKYVTSRSADTELDHPNSDLLVGDATEHVNELRERIDVPVTIMGSGELVRALHAAGLIDAYTLLVHPIVLGSGSRLFGEADRVDLELEQAIPTTTGVVIATDRDRIRGRPGDDEPAARTRQTTHPRRTDSPSQFLIAPPCPSACPRS